MSVTVPTVKLNNGYEMPVLGLGTYYSESAWQVKDAVKYAIDAGYRHFDCAYFYGNEKEVGEGLKEKIAEGVVTREDLFITTKLWNNFHATDKVVPACKESLKNLDLDYIDLFLIHWPVGFKEDAELWPIVNDSFLTSDVDYLDTWKGMEECVNLGLTRSIGISNFNSEQVKRVVDNCTIKPVTNQVECNPYINQKRLIAFCKARDITITAYTPLAKHDQRGGSLTQDPKLVAIASKYKKTAAQVILRYLVDIGTLPIPKSVSKERIAANINIFDFKLTPEEIQVMDGFNQNKRIVDFAQAKGHKYFPFDLEF